MSEETVLFLGPNDSPLLDWLRTQESRVIDTMAAVTPQWLDEQGVTFAVSYRYRRVLKEEVLARLPDRIVKLNLAYLPWNRGTDPNFWSFFDNTPKGVSVHYADRGVDTGDVIAQEEVVFPEGEKTLASTDEILRERIEALFRPLWPDIRRGTCPRRPQEGTGSVHRMQDKEPYMPFLAEGPDTPVAVVEELGRRFHASPVNP